MREEPRPRLLFVDDDREITSALDRFFRRKGYPVVLCHAAEEALCRLDEVDAAIIDINLPGRDGFELCREIRAHHDMPVIILSGESSETDRIVGLELGADDYVLKPFSARELEARLKAVLRRTTNSENTPLGDQLQFDNFVVDTMRQELRNDSGQVIELTGGEYKLLMALLQHPNRIVTRDQLLDWTRGRVAGPFDRSIDVQIGKLRAKLGDSGPRYRLIQTRRGEGYVLTTRVERSKGALGG